MDSSGSKGTAGVKKVKILTQHMRVLLKVRVRQGLRRMKILTQDLRVPMMVRESLELCWEGTDASSEDSHARERMIGVEPEGYLRSISEFLFWRWNDWDYGAKGTDAASEGSYVGEGMALVLNGRTLTRI